MQLLLVVLLLLVVVVVVVDFYAKTLTLNILETLFESTHHYRI